MQVTCKRYTTNGFALVCSGDVVLVVEVERVLLRELECHKVPICDKVRRSSCLMTALDIAELRVGSVVLPVSGGNP